MKSKNIANQKSHKKERGEKLNGLSEGFWAGKEATRKRLPKEATRRRTETQRTFLDPDKNEDSFRRHRAGADSKKGDEIKDPKGFQKNFVETSQLALRGHSKT